MRLLGLMVVVVASLAFAGWRQVGTLTGTPQDVVVADAGVVVATSNTGAFAWRAEADGGVTPIASLSGALVGAGLFDAGCLVALDATGNVVFTTGCGTATPSGSSAGRHLRLSGDVLVLQVTAGISDTLRTGPVAGPWPTVGNSWTAPSARALQTARIGGVDYHLSNSSAASYLVSVDGGPTTSIAVPAAVRDLSPFERQGLPAALVISTAGALTLLPDLRSSTAITPTLPVGLTGRYVGMTRGAGMITTTTGEVLSPVPDPAREAQAWRVRSNAPPLLTNHVNCLDARWCAAIDSSLGVFLYENASPPQVAVAPVRVDAGATVRLTVDGGDPDGDPLFFSWSGAGTFTPVTGAEDGVAIELGVPASAACGPLTVEVTARDGLNSTVFPIDVQVVGKGTLQLVSPSQQPWAGGPPVAVSAFVDGGCESAAIAWSSSDGQSSGSGAFSWTPPATSCIAGGEVITLTATATWGQGAPTTATTQLTVEPWGAPFAPVFAPAVQPAGTVRVWSPTGPEHVCTSAAFPGTELLWEPLDGGPFSLRAVAAGLELTAPECVRGQVIATARRQVIGEQHGRVSDAGTLVVDVEPQLAPLDATTPFGVTAAADAGVVFGALSVMASCVDQRVLSAELSVLEGATTVAVRDFTVPGPWALTVPGGCAGGPRQIVARLKEDGGLTGAIAMDTVTLDSTPVAIGAQTPERVEVVCGTGGRARVQLLPVDGACAAAATSWRVIDGPALVTSAGEGTHFELETASADLSAAGRQLTIEWSSDGGQGNAASGTRTLDFTVAPFVAVAVKTSPVLRQEEAATLFEVQLSNSTACAVDGLTVELPLAGAAPQVDTVQLDGTKATATLEGTTLRLEGVSLPADGARVVRFAARSRLLGAPSLAPTVWLNGLEVTLARFEERPASACGCSGGGGPLFVGLMLLVVLRRRRHHGEGADQGM